MFEFDEAKSKSDKDKHGIDFLEAQALWDDPYLYKYRPRPWMSHVTLLSESLRASTGLRSSHIEVIAFASFPCVGLAPKRWRSMKAEAFDRKFESDQDIIDDLDLENASRPRLQARRVNVDFPGWMVDELDQEARRLGVTRQSIIKVWLAERLEQTASKTHRSG